MFESVMERESLRDGPVGDGRWLDAAWPDEGWLDDVMPEPPLREWASVGLSSWRAAELDERTGDPALLSDAALIDGIVASERMAARAQARQARLLAEFARRRPADDPLAAQSNTPSGCSAFAPDEIGLALRLSRTAASARLAMACTLAEDLPGTLAAWEQGRLDLPKVRAVTEIAWSLPSERRRMVEDRVLPRAGEQTVAQLRSALGRAVLAIDPEGAAERHRQRRQDRRVEVVADGDGMASLWALLPAPAATAAYQRLTHLAHGLGAEDPRRMDARRADLLVDLLTGTRCAGTAAPLDSGRSAAEGVESSGGGHGCRPAGPGKPLVHVIVPLTMLMGLDEQPGELVGHGPIPADLAREIAADGTWRRLLTDPASGALLDHGRRSYTPPAGLAGFVRARDVVCRFPTCRQPAARADLDHTVPYPDGTTSAANLHAACRHHHRTKTHAPGWRLRQDDDGQITYVTPTGHRYTSQPYDYRSDHPPDRPPRPPTRPTPRE